MSQLAAIGFIAAGAALYGFVIAYYAFARSLLNQIQWQMEYRAREWDVVSGPDPVEAFQANFQFRVALHRFLLVATLAFFLSMVANTNFVFTGDALWSLAGSLLFGLLVAVTAVWFAYVAVSGLSKGQSELRDLEDFLADALGTKYPPPGPREDHSQDE